MNAMIRVSNKNVYFMKGIPLYLWTIKPVYHGDWKSSNRTPIPAGEKIKVEDVMTNCYGIWIETHYDGKYYSIKPEDVEFRREASK